MSYIILDCDKDYDISNFIIGKEVKNTFDGKEESSKYYLYYIYPNFYNLNLHFQRKNYNI